MGEVHTCVLLKNSVNFDNNSFLLKEGSNNKNLDIILFACSRGVKNICFVTVDPRICKLWVFVEKIIHNRFLFINFAVVCSEEGQVKKIFTL